MAAPFAAIESATAANAVAALANATATIGAAAVEGIFDAEYGEGFAQISGVQPSFLAMTDDVSGVEAGDSITINATSYTVSGEPQPDGTGMTRLMLHLA